MKYLEIIELTQLDYDAVRNTLPADKGVIITDNPTANFAIGDGQFSTGGGSTLTQTFLTYTDQSGTLSNAINIGDLAADATNNVLTFSVAGTSATPTATTLTPSTFAVANALGELEFTNSIVTGDQILSIDAGTATIGLTSATNTLTGVNALVGATTVTGATTLNGQLTNTTGDTAALIDAGTSTVSMLGTGGIFLGNIVGSTAISLLSGTATTNLLGSQIILASADTRLTLIPAGTGTALNIDANGTIQSTVSSLQFKENILDYTDEELNSARVFDLVPKKFTFKGSGKASYGFIAEEVHEILPEVVNLCKEGKPYSIQYEMIPFFLLNEVKKLKTQVDALTAQVAALAP